MIHLTTFKIESTEITEAPSKICFNPSFLVPFGIF